MSAPRVVWLNGPFGAGKTTTARLLTGARGDRVLLDPELVGGFLVHHLGPVDDFQDLRAWRTLAAADLVVDTDRRTVTEVRDLVEALLADGRPGVG